MNKSRANYLKAIVWFVLSLVVSCGNDVLVKYIGTHISPWQVAFFRCFFGTLTLLPLMLYHGQGVFKTDRLLMHGVRGGLLFVAIGLWSCGVQTAPITTATIISFTVPIFVLILAPIFLQERVTWLMWLATLIGFVGIVLVLQPDDGVLQASSALLVIAAMLFGMLDIINKKYVAQEPLLCMLFYSTLFATVFLALPALYASGLPMRYEWLWLLVLGIGSNLILYFLLQAFALARATALAPFRYLELLISMGMGYALFQELPNGTSYLGAAMIIPSTLLTVYYQDRNDKE